MYIVTDQLSIKASINFSCYPGAYHIRPWRQIDWALDWALRSHPAWSLCLCAAARSLAAVSIAEAPSRPHHASSVQSGLSVYAA